MSHRTRLLVMSVVISLVTGLFVTVAPSPSVAPVQATVGLPSEPSPWVVFVHSRGTDCTGSLIAPHWVLTAGHCAPLDGAGNYTIAFGNSFIGKGFNRPVQRTRRSVKHPYSDLRLIYLPQPTPVEPVSLSTQMPQPGTPLEIRGYGKVFAKRLPVELLRSALLITIRQQGDRILAFSLAGTPSLGDSGGPILLDGRLVGVHASSGVPDNGLIGWLKSYETSIHGSISWIRRVTGEAFSDA